MNSWGLCFLELLMNILTVLQQRVSLALSSMVADPSLYLSMIRPAQDAKFGDYQVNCAMPLKAVLNKNPQEIAHEIIAKLNWQDLFHLPEVAGPGFINLKLLDEPLLERVKQMCDSASLGVDPNSNPKTIVVDFSSPNVAKPMHVGHLRSTVIGDAIARIHRYLGHKVITDNHIGDWGTQFGMIIYGYKHFLDHPAFENSQVKELARLYRLVNVLCDYHAAKNEIAGVTALLNQAKSELSNCQNSPHKDPKEQKKLLKKYQDEVNSQQEALSSLTKKIESTEADAHLNSLAKLHPHIIRDSRLETAKLHAGDVGNKNLWDQFIPACLAALQTIYNRLDIKFDYTLGESYYNPMLASVVEELKSKGLARVNEGAVCVFKEGNTAPLIIQKTDGAFTYGTTDLATIRYRLETWQADAMYYVVDSRQAEHFELLFDSAKRWGYEKVDYRHISFGTVMGKDNKPYKTRSGDTVGLESLLDEAIARARKIVDENISLANEPEEYKQFVAEAVGLGGVKYADLMHNRDSNYIFDYDKMLASKGNTSTYIQYAIARINGIFRKANLERGEFRKSPTKIILTKPEERQLVLQLSRFHEALEEVTRECRPHFLCQYLFETAETLARFYDQCQVLGDVEETTKLSRLALIDIVASVLEQGLLLLGIGHCEKM